jgi:dienelactone hydrolase
MNVKNRSVGSLFGFLAGVLAIVSLSGCITTEPFLTKDERIVPDSDGKRERLTIRGVYAKPKGNGPFPAVVILQSCGGSSPALSTWADKFNEWGYASFIVQSLESRGSRTCVYPYKFYEMNSAVASDAYGALDYLIAKPEIDPGRVAAIGFSMGALAINWNILSSRASRPQPDFAATISFYGKCHTGNMYGLRWVPNLQVAAELDKNHYPSCERMQRLFDGPNYQFLGLKGVHHAFDDPAASGKYDGSGNRMEYNPDATQQATIAVRKFLLEQFKK